MAPIYCVVKLFHKSAQQRQREIKSVTSLNPIEIPSISAFRCRICLKDESTIPIFPVDGSLETQEAIKDFTGLPLSADDRYPKHLCEQCNNLLKSAIIFKETAKKSYKILTNMENVIKKELLEMETVELKETATATEDDTLCKVDQEYDTILQQYFDEDEMENINTEQILETGTVAETPDFTEDKPLHPQENCPDNVTQNKKLKFDAILKNYFDEVEINENGEFIKINPDEKDLLTVSKVQCRICSKVVQQVSCRNHYKLHVQNSRSSLICDICGKCFRSKLNCEIHMTTHSTQFPFKCQFCPYKGRHSGLLKTHLKIHNREYKHKCTVCSAQFVNSSNLIRHSYTHKEPTIKCSHCNKKFHTQSRMQKHFKANHLGIRDHVCNLCGVTFGFRRGLRKHEIKVHKIEKNKICGRLPSYLAVKKDDS